MTRTRIGLLSALAFLLVGYAALAETNESGYRILKKFEIGGEGGWDYLTADPDAHRLYISRGNRVMVVDTETGKVVGEVADTAGIHGIALDTKRKKGFTSNGKDSTVTIFDLETLKETGRTKVGNRPDGILYDPGSDRVFTFNAGTKDATALDAETGKVAGTVELKGKPESATTDGKGTVYVNIEDKDEVVALDAKELKVKARFPTAPGKAPVGLSMDQAKGRLFVTCGNEKMVVMEADGGKILANLPIGKRTDYGAFDPGTGLAFSSNGDGTLTVVEEKPQDTYRVLANVKTMVGARTMALDTKTHNVYLVTARFKPADPNEKGRRPTMEPNTFVVLVVGKGESK